MKENNQLALVFPSVHGNMVVADFERGVVIFDAGHLLRETEQGIVHCIYFIKCTVVHTIKNRREWR